MEDDKIRCLICGVELKQIGANHLKRRHNGMSTDEYRKMFSLTSLTALGIRGLLEAV